MSAQRGSPHRTTPWSGSAFKSVNRLCSRLGGILAWKAADGESGAEFRVVLPVKAL